MANLGLALDIGTSNIAGFLIDLDKRQDHFSLSIKNSQLAHGGDVVSRLTFAANSPNGLKVLQQALVNDVNNIIHVLSGRIGINRKRLDRIVVAGNNIILHFLLGLQIDGLLAYPYKSQIEGSTNINAEDIGIVAGKKTKLISLPPISPYVGSDAVAGILYCGMHKFSSLKLLVDLGTNAEIVLGNKNKIYATSAAAGPAFKNRNIPLGSKMISLVAQMLDKGNIDSTGKLVKSGDNIDQDDIRALQLAKGAVNAATAILLKRSGHRAEDISKILLAGLFGEKIDRKDSMSVGLIPKVEMTKVRAVGNSSLGGARKALLDPGLLAVADKIARSVEHIELSMETEYQQNFINSINF